MAGLSWLSLLFVFPLIQGCGDGAGDQDVQIIELRGQPIHPEKSQPDDVQVASVGSESPAGATETQVDNVSTNGPEGSVDEEVSLTGNSPDEVPVEEAGNSLDLETDNTVLTEVPSFDVEEINGFKTVGFEKLSSFEFEVSDEILNPSTENPEDLKEKTDSQIPQAIKDLNQAKVALKGFMLPLKVEGGLVTEMLVMKDQSMCCFGTVPKINEWVSVIMVDEGVKPIMDQPVTLFGKLNVGEMRENGYLVGIYSLDGEDMTGPLDE